MTRGKFITFEGDDAAGKSTQVTLLETALREHGIDVLKTREPGGTPMGEKLRHLLLHGGEGGEGNGLDGMGETLILLAARRIHLQQKILPALDAGTWVICDRFTDSTLAYQGGGRGVDKTFISALAKQVLEDTTPDLTFYLHTPPSKTRNPLLGGDTFEREDDAFRLLVSTVFQALAKEQSQRIVQIDNQDGNGQWRDREAIGEEIWRITATRLLREMA